MSNGEKIVNETIEVEKERKKSMINERNRNIVIRIFLTFLPNEREKSRL